MIHRYMNWFSSLMMLSQRKVKNLIHRLSVSTLLPKVTKKKERSPTDGVLTPLPKRKLFPRSHGVNKRRSNFGMSRGLKQMSMLRMESSIWPSKWGTPTSPQRRAIILMKTKLWPKILSGKKSTMENFHQVPIQTSISEPSSPISTPRF